MVLDLIDRLPKCVDNTHIPKLVCVDNYFTTYELVEQCTERKVSLIGTFQLNRAGNAPLTDLKAMKKKDRGTFETFTKEEDGNTTALTAWKDNGVVRVLSNCYGVEPVQKAKRWNRVEMREDMIPMPFAIQLYNKFMGGTDRQDQNINKYRIAIRSKKWWWALFSSGIDATVQNAWLLKRKTNPKYMLVDFLRDIVWSYFSVHGTRPHQSHVSKQ